MDTIPSFPSPPPPLPRRNPDEVVDRSGPPPAPLTDPQWLKAQQHYKYGVMAGGLIVLSTLAIISLKLAYFPDTNPAASTPTPTVAPSPTPIPRSAVTLEVINASSNKKALNAVVTRLGAAGFRVTAQTTAKTPAKDTIIHLSATHPLPADLFTDLTSILNLTATSGSTLTDATTSARLVIGKNWQP